MANRANLKWETKKSNAKTVKQNFGILFALFFITILVTNSFAKQRMILDTIRIHEDYKNGDFDKVIQSLESFRKTKKVCTLPESLFVEKHLAVVYAANPATRERGRYHMYKLLDLAADANLLEMFVGEELDGVFEKVRKEHEATKVVSQAIKNDSPEKPVTRFANKDEIKVVNTRDEISTSALPSDGAVSESNSETSWKSAGTWIGGGAALALLALTIYYSDSPKDPQTKTYVVPATASR